MIVTYNPELDKNPSPSGIILSTPFCTIKFDPLIPVSIDDGVWEKAKSETVFTERLENGSLMVEPKPKATASPKRSD